MSRPLFYCLAAVVPFAALWLATPAERSVHGLAVSPFGWPSLLVVQCVVAVPLAAVVAGWLARRVKGVSTIPAAVAGLILAVVGHYSVSALAGLLDPAADFVSRCLVRSTLCLLLALPWAVGARVGSPASRGGSWVMLAVGLVAAFVLPGVWAETLAREQTAAAQEELAASRITRGRRLIDGLCDLDPHRSVVATPKDLPTLRRGLVAEEQSLSAYLTATAPAALKPSDRLRYANALVALDRHEEAEPILRELVKSQPQANLPLARVLHLQGRYTESDAAARELVVTAVAELERFDERRGAVVREKCLDAFEMLVENATRRGSNADREAVLKEGLEKLPGEEAYFRFQLGRHYKLSGRPIDAVRELNLAVALDKKYEPRAEALLRDLRQLTPACLIGR